MSDVWAHVPGFPGWVVSARGEVRYAPTWKLAGKASPSDSGYARVDMGGKKVRVHRVVLFAFAGPPPTPRHHGAHVDGDKTNNRFENLAWKTPEENEADKRAHGTAPRGRSKKKIPPQVVGRMRAAFLRGESVSRIARRHRLHRKTVARHVKGVGGYR